MIVKNLDDLTGLERELLFSTYINIALAAYEDGVYAVDPYKATLKYLHIDEDGKRLEFKDKVYDLSKYQHIYVIGAGKAGVRMGTAIHDLLGDKITEGCMCVQQDSGIQSEKLGNIRFIECSHPIPDMDSMLGARMITQIASKATEHDLLFCLFSGGGSSLMAMPCDGITMDEKQAANNLLLKCGANITEINTVRRHLSGVKGGKLAALAYPAEVIQLLLSDVMGNKAEFIASGPMVPETTTFEEAINILKRHAIWESIPSSVASRLNAGCMGRISESVAPNAKSFEKITTAIIADNAVAISAIAQSLEDSCLKVFYYPKNIEGEATLASNEIFQYIAHLQKQNESAFAVVAGGEATVTFKRQSEGRGSRNLTSRFMKGGRAQEMALAMYKPMHDIPNTRMIFLAAGTDGIDGPTDAAGAIITPSAIQRAIDNGIIGDDYLASHNSYNFFKNVGGLIKTGYTGTNVNDIVICIVPAR